MYSCSIIIRPVVVTKRFMSEVFLSLHTFFTYYIAVVNDRLSNYVSQYILIHPDFPLAVCQWSCPPIWPPMLLWRSTLVTRCVFWASVPWSLVFDSASWTVRRPLCRHLLHTIGTSCERRRPPWPFGGWLVTWETIRRKVCRAQ